MITETPTILKRYLSTLLDGTFIIFTFLLVSYVFQQEQVGITIIRVTLMIAMFFIYEPLFTSKFCTLGRKITGIRVRELETLSKIPIHKACFREIVKVLPGLISFFTIPLTQNRRGIHDFAAGSVVINVYSK